MRYPFKSNLRKPKTYSQPKKIAIMLGVSFAIALVSWYGYGYFGTEYQTGKVIVCRWAWHIDVERWDRKHYDRAGRKHPSSCRDPSFCGGTYNSRSWTEYDDDDDFGSTYYEYDHDEWVWHRTFSLTGTDKEPHPPEYVLERPQTAARTQHQCQMSDTRRPYTVLIECSDGKGRVWTTTNFNIWKTWTKGDLCDVNLTGFGDVRSISPLKIEIE